MGDDNRERYRIPVPDIAFAVCPRAISICIRLDPRALLRPLGRSGAAAGPFRLSPICVVAPQNSVELNPPGCEA